MRSFPNPACMVYAIILSFILSTFSCSKDTELLSEVLERSIDDSEIIESTQGDTTENTTEDADTPPSPTEEESDPNIVQNTSLTISGKQFYINGELTYKGRYWQGNKIEGLLMNSRMVQGIFDDLNSSTNKQFKYPDTNEWDADRNTDEFISAMQEWKSNGLLAFTLNLQGGSPTGYGNAQPWINSAFNENGGLRPAYLSRLKRILKKADELEMVVILGYFYFGQDQVLKNENAVVNAVDNITDWILNEGYQNLLIEISNECDHPTYDHAILKPNRIHELINRVKQKEKNGFRLLVSTSYRGGVVPKASVAKASDYLLFHGNGVGQPSKMRSLLRDVRNVQGGGNKPIIVNEDDHYDFDANDNNFKASVEEYASWGYFDFRREGETFKEGYQTVPIDWGINSNRKRAFFSKVKQITGY